VTRGMHRRRATFHEVFTVREFRPLFGSTLLSTLGDELARVALTVLVYQRTTSPLLSAITFAISYLPWLVGGPLLSTLADRFPRRRVLLTTDALRALVVAVMAVPGTPLPLLLVLLFVLACGAPPFESARSALTADLLDAERYAVANSMTTVGFHLAQGLGFVVGAALAAAANPSVVLLMGAATYAASAPPSSAGPPRRPRRGLRRRSGRRPPAACGSSSARRGCARSSPSPGSPASSSRPPTAWPRRSPPRSRSVRAPSDCCSRPARWG
jgi:MFS family permease